MVTVLKILLAPFKAILIVTICAMNGYCGMDKGPLINNNRKYLADMRRRGKAEEILRDSHEG